MKLFKLTFLLTALLSAVGANVFAHDIAVANADGVTIYYVWANNQTELAVSHQGSSYSSYSYEYTGAVNIPESVTYNGKTYPVTSIDDDAFYGCSGLTTVTIPNSVTSIGEWAFYNCSSLTSVTIPNSVTSIVGRAFEGTAWYKKQPNGLVYAGKVAYEYKGKMPANTKIILEDGTLGISTYAFENCSGLTSIEIPNSVTSISEGAFRGCSGLSSVTIPNRVTTIGSRAFRNCSGLTSVTIPGSVTSIEWLAFEGCSGLSAVHITDLEAWCKIHYDSAMDPYCNPLYYAHHLYLNGEEIKNLVIPNSVTSICDYAFRGCSGLTSVTIPNSVTSIGNGAFENCSGLTSVTIPSSVTNIGGGAFSGCSGLTSVTIPSSVTSIGGSAFSGCSGLTSVAIPGSVTSIGYEAFSGCSGLTSVTIGNGVTSIGWRAFHGCSGLTSVTIPGSVTSIGDEAFYGCSGLTSVTIPNSVTSIGWRAFYNTYLKSVTIGSGVLSIGSRAFDYEYSDTGARPVKVIWLPNTPPDGYSDAAGTVNYVSNDLYTKLSNSNKTVYPFLSSMFEVDGVKYVPVSPAERTCDAIDCVYAPSTVTTKFSPTASYRGITMSVQKVQPYVCYENSYIENLVYDIEGDMPSYALYNCSNLKKVTLGEKVKSIGSSAFSNCTSLPSIVIPESIESIGSYAFSNCAALPKVVIPSKVATISNYVFNGCTQLKEAIMDDSPTELSLGSNGSDPLFSSCPLDSVYIGRNISYSTSSSYGYSPFYRNTSLRSVTITDKETEISPNEFYGCTNLKNVRIGDGVETIGNWAFSGCSSLDYFSFGSSVKTIGQEAFSDCTAMTRLISHATTPPTCGSQALDDINKWNCTLSVPEGTTSAYQAAEQWKEFFFINNDIVTGIHQVDSGELTTDSWYSLDGKKLAGEPKEKGIYIRNGRKVVK